MKGITWFSFTTVWTLAAIYRLEEGGFDPLQLVLAGTVMELAIFLFEVPTGVVADVQGRRRSVIIGHLIMGAGFFLEGLWPGVGTILLAQAVFGLGYTLISGAEDAWLADEIGEARFPAVLLRGTQAEQLGAFLGIGASVVLASFDLAWPFLFGGFCLWIQALLLWRLMPETGFRRRETNVLAHTGGSWQDLWTTLRQGLSFTWRRPLLLTLMGITFCYGLASEGVDRLWEAHLLENFLFPTWWGLSPLVWLGGISAAVMLGTLLVTEGLRRNLGRRAEEADGAEDDPGGVAAPATAGDFMGVSPRRLLWLQAVQSVLVIGGLVVFATTGHFLVAVGTFIVVNILRRIVQPLFLACVNRGLDSSVRATVLSTVNQMNAIGEVAGGPMVGAVGATWGLRVALLTVAGFLAPVWGLYRRALRLLR